MVQVSKSAPRHGVLLRAMHRFSLHWPSQSQLFILGITLLIAFLVLYPIGWLLYGSLRSAPPFEDGVFTLTNYVRAYQDPVVWSSLLNTAIFSVGQALLSVGLGTVLAWILTRTNTPGRSVFELLTLTLFLAPTILAVVAWSLLLGGGRGLINNALISIFGFSEPPFDVASMGGMIFVQGLYLTPLAFLIIAPVLASADAAMEEAARISGSSLPDVLRHITIPLAWPAVFSAFILMFIVGVESFEVPQLLGAPKGIYTYTSLIFHSIQVRYPPDFGLGTALAASLLLMSIVMVQIYRRATAQTSRYETMKGKGYSVRVMDLGKWRWVTFSFCIIFFFITVILPGIILILGSLLQYYGQFDLSIFTRMSWQNYLRLFDHPTLQRGFVNSLILSVVGGAVCVLLSAVVSYISVKTRLPGRGILESTAMLPISFPATVLGVALLWAYIALPLPIYGTLLILAIAYITRYIPIGVRTVTGGVMQISSELEDASRISGASWLRTFVRIVLPLAKPTLFAAWLLMFMIFFRELSMSILLAGPGNPVISVVMYDYYTSGEMGLLSALSLVIVLAILLIVWIMRRLMGISFTDFKV